MSLDKTILLKTRSSPSETVAAGSAIFWLDGQTLKYKDDTQTVNEVTIGPTMSTEAVQDIVGALISSINNRLTAYYDDPSNAFQLTLNEANIVHQNISGAGTNTHSQIDTHLTLGANPHMGVAGAGFDGAGSVPTAGTLAMLVCPYAGTIQAWDVVSDAIGSAVIDVWKLNAAIPTVANTITAAAKPTLTAAQLAGSSTLTGWTTAVAAGDVFIFKLDSVSTLTKVSVSLRIAKT